MKQIGKSTILAAGVALLLLAAACSEEMVVNTSFRKDLLPPAVTVTSPSNQQTVMPPFTLAGTVSDLGAVTNLTVYIQAQSGGPIYTFETLPTNEVFTLSVQLSNLAAYRLWIRAIDDKGNSTNTEPMTINVSASVLYVAPGGDDNGPGTAALPMASIQKAVERAAAVGISNVYVKQGSYTPGAGLNAAGSTSGVEIRADRIQLIGGWNNDYSAQSGKSILDGQWQVKHVIYMSLLANVKIDGFQIVHGKADGAAPHYAGGGIFMHSTVHCVVTNSSVASNSCSLDGGGILLNGSTSVYLSVECFSNFANNGAGIFTSGSYDTTIKGFVFNNKAVTYGGGIYVNSANTVINSIVTNNRAIHGGGLMVSGSYCTIKGKISGNIATGSGGGILLERSGIGTSIENCVISGNSSVDSGNAIWNHASDTRIYQCSIFNNTGSPEIICLLACNYIEIGGNTISGAPSGSFTAIYEAGFDTSSHRLVNNTFTNATLTQYYFDWKSMISTKNLSVLNDKNYSGAAEANNNAAY